MDLIAICGKKYNGKDTVANYLCDHYGYTKLSFADAIKNSVQCIFGFSDAQLWGDEKEIIDDYWRISPREILQYFGTECMRDCFGAHFPHISDNIWVMAIERKISQLSHNGTSKIVIADLRFDNEMDFIKKYNGTVIKVTRNIANRDTHVSENCTLSGDYTIDNNGSIDELYAEIEKIMRVRTHLFLC